MSKIGHGMTLQEMTFVKKHRTYNAGNDTKTQTHVMGTELISHPSSRDDGIALVIWSTDFSSSLGCANKETVEA